MSDKIHKQKSEQPGPTGQSAEYDPPGWISTEELEEELFAAAVADSNGARAEVDFERIDAYFAADHTETEAEYQRSLLRLIADLRPQLAELLGGPRRNR